MPDVVKPGPGGGGGGDEDEQRQDETVMDVMGNSGGDFPLQVCQVRIILSRVDASTKQNTLYQNNDMSGRDSGVCWVEL